MMVYFDIGIEPFLDPPEPDREYCCRCGNPATEYWPKTDSVYCSDCAFTVAYDWLTGQSVEQIIELAGFESIEPYGRT